MRPFGLWHKERVRTRTFKYQHPINCECVFAQGAWESPLGPRWDVRTALWGLRTVIGLGRSPQGKGGKSKAVDFQNK